MKNLKVFFYSKHPLSFELTLQKKMDSKLRNPRNPLSLELVTLQKKSTKFGTNDFHGWPYIRSAWMVSASPYIRSACKRGLLGKCFTSYSTPHGLNKSHNDYNEK